MQLSCRAQFFVSVPLEHLTPHGLIGGASTNACIRASGDSVTRKLSEGQRAYEARRAAKAGMSLDKWLAAKEKEREADARVQRRAEPAKAAKKPGLFKRLLERAQRPL